MGSRDQGEVKKKKKKERGGGEGGRMSVTSQAHRLTGSLEYRLTGLQAHSHRPTAQCVRAVNYYHTTTTTASTVSCIIHNERV